jgi:catechol 2,3-dioxygenase-like lactoylglutathione lyase family enzyme
VDRQEQAGGQGAELVVLNRVVIYSKNIQKMADFYVRHFSFVAEPDTDGRMINLFPLKGGATISLHPAAKSQRMGQVLVKLTFDFDDISGFSKKAARGGLKFGAIWKADGYEFANAKDPDGNSISISSKAFSQRGR